MLEGYVKDNNYARFHTHSFHRCSGNRKPNFDVIVDFEQDKFFVSQKLILHKPHHEKTGFLPIQKQR